MLEEVRKTKKSILVTRFGKPIAEVHPLSPLQEGGIWLGSIVGEIKFLGDVVAPVLNESDWKESEQ